MITGEADNFVKIAACQLPELRGDIDNAIACIHTFAKQAEEEGVQLLCFPECYLQGYLVERELANRYALDVSSTEFNCLLKRLPATGPMLVIGMIEKEHSLLYNTAIVINEGRLVGSYRKTHLLAGENIFIPGTCYPIFETGGLRFGINICYDTNFKETAIAIAEQGAHLIVCPANNMMSRQKSVTLKNLHNELRAQRCMEAGLWLISSDVTGERDNKISCGPTAVISPAGQVVAQVPLFQIGMVSANIPLHPQKISL